jgi:hypothetical protein
MEFISGEGRVEPINSAANLAAAAGVTHVRKDRLARRLHASAGPRL